MLVNQDTTVFNNVSPYVFAQGGLHSQLSWLNPQLKITDIKNQIHK